jgi:Zn-dependent metalloprotease
MSHYSSILCIVPPHMLKNIADNGTPAQRQTALNSLVVSARVRGQRQVLAEVRSLIPRLASSGKYRVIYTADNGSNLPGRKLRQEGDPPTGDLAADEAYDGAGATYDLYWDTYQRNSIDDLGLQLDSTVHYQQGYDNAFWDGKQMVYGDGDEDLPESERIFNRFTIAIDVIGHELTHGVTQYEANLNYFLQPGALNESISDVFGSLVKQHSLGQTASEADWIIGEGLLTANVNGVGIRSMKAPGTAYDDPVLGKDPQPDHMNNYVNTLEDNGGVHINSGIPNKAFYVVATEIGGSAWEKAGLIWYTALASKLTSNSNFQDAADKTYEAAGELYGVGSLEQKAVQTGWGEVGITVGTSNGGGGNGGGGGDGCLSAPLTWFKSLFGG